MLKVKCSKYPEYKCLDCETATFEKCAICCWNLYQNVNYIGKLKDYFKEV